MPLNLNMISNIERNALDWLQQRWPVDINEKRIAQFDIGKDFSDINQFPAVAAATESIGMRRNPDGSISFAPVISLYLVFKNVARPDQRRAGIYPIITGVVSLLSGRTLGLEIEPLLPLPAKEIYHNQLKEIGGIGYLLQFKTDFDIDKIDEQQAIDLLSIAIKYYDALTDIEVAEDIIDFS